MLLVTIKKERKTENLKNKKWKKEIKKRDKSTNLKKNEPRLSLKPVQDFYTTQLKRNIFDQESHLHIEDFWLFTDHPVNF